MLPRPADLQEALSSLANGAALTDAEKKKAAAGPKPKRTTKKKKVKSVDVDDDSYHYVGQVFVAKYIQVAHGLKDTYLCMEKYGNLTGCGPVPWRSAPPRILHQVKPGWMSPGRLSDKRWKAYKVE